MNHLLAMPPLAMLAYALAMAIGLIVAEPKDTPIFGPRPGDFLGMPRSTAMSTTFWGPSSAIDWVRSTKAVLIESSVAFSKETFEP